MNKFINEIRKIRKENELSIDENNKRHRIVVLNEDNSKSMYCFSVPIRNIRTNSIVDLKFHNEGGFFSALGSSVSMEFNDKIRVLNKNGICEIDFGMPLVYKDEYTLGYGEESEISLTSNGIVCTTYSKNKDGFMFKFELSNSYSLLSENNCAFSLMIEKFTPYFTVSSIGCYDERNNLIAPVEVKYFRIAEKKWGIKVVPCVENYNQFKFEINFHDEKIIQDTTVESLRPQKRNPFGGMAYIGNTEWFGTQWLYIRPELIFNHDVLSMNTERVKLYLPKLNDSFNTLKAYKTAYRFCSFGSRWAKKIGEFLNEVNIEISEDYISLDLTDICINKTQKTVDAITGVVIKQVGDANGFVAVATGDNYYRPAILEIKNK